VCSVARTFYKAYDADGILLYVGVALNVEKRMNEHRQYFRGYGLCPWRPLMQSYETEEYESRTDALNAEADAIEAEHPVYNRWPGVRTGSPVSIYRK